MCSQTACSIGINRVVYSNFKYLLYNMCYVRRVMSRETQVYYCGKTIQNEIININGNLTRVNILG